MNERARKSERGIVLVLTVILTSGVLGPALAEAAIASSLQPVGRILAVQGSVQAMSPGEEDWRGVSTGSPVHLQESIRTNDKAKTVIELVDGRQIVLDDFSAVALQPMDDEGAGSIRVEVLEGRIRVIPAHAAQETHTVRTATALISAVGDQTPANLVVEVFSSGKTVVTVVTGGVLVASLSSGERRSVEWCHGATVDAGPVRIRVERVYTELVKDLWDATTLPAQPPLSADACIEETAPAPSGPPPSSGR